MCLTKFKSLILASTDNIIFGITGFLSSHEFSYYRSYMDMFLLTLAARCNLMFHFLILMLFRVPLIHVLECTDTTLFHCIDIGSE